MPHTPSSPGDPREADEPRTNADEAKTDAAVHAFNARVQWPLSAAEAPTVSPTGDAANRSPQPPQKQRNKWRTVGIVALGLLGGLLFGVVLQDILATIMIQTGLTGLSFVFALVIPLFAAVGAVATLVFDKWFARRRRSDSHECPASVHSEPC